MIILIQSSHTATLEGGGESILEYMKPIIFLHM